MEATLTFFFVVFLPQPLAQIDGLLHVAHSTDMAAFLLKANSSFLLFASQ